MTTMRAMRIDPDVVELDGSDLVIKQYHNGEVVRRVKVDLESGWAPIGLIEQISKLLKRRAEEANRNLQTARAELES